MLDHLLLVEWNTMFIQHIENTLKIYDILLKCEISLTLVEYLIFGPLYQLASYVLIMTCHHIDIEVPALPLCYT